MPSSAPACDFRVIWITGAAGLIGNELARRARAGAFRAAVHELAREELELTDFQAVARRFASDRPDLIIHCAALSRSPDCQADPARARRENVEVTRTLAGLGAEIAFVFFSTDLVFDGRRGGYREEDALNPLSVYGETKAVAEGLVLANPAHLVVRTSLNGGRSLRGDRGFNEELRRAWAAGRATRLFVDEFRSPIAAAATAAAVWELACQRVSGIYHVAGAERLSRWEIGQLLAERWRALRPELLPGSLREYTGAPRPPDTSLDCGKAQRRLSFPLPRFSEWLRAQPPGAF